MKLNSKIVSSGSCSYFVSWQAFIDDGLKLASLPVKWYCYHEIVENCYFVPLPACYLINHRNPSQPADCCYNHLDSCLSDCYAPF